jgi:hypothetical protein
MVPGMVGAVNYGTARKSYDPTQTVAGKTGTCIGQGGWVGSFTSYAPLANPRLAVVVIAQGTDGRRHFPVQVAGEIYRQLNHRFGTSINLQVASTLDDQEKEIADAEADAENADAANADATTTEGTNGETTKAATATATPAPNTTVAPAAAKPATSEPKNTVKRVLMPLEKKTVEAPKSNTTSTKTTQTPATSAPGEQRPRRIQP